MRSIICTVAFRSPNWSQVLIGSFREWYPTEKILVIDNNKVGSKEGEWLQKQSCVIYQNNHTFEREMTHGFGIDAAAAWCRTNGFDIMTLVEPDCHITSSVWREQLEIPIREDRMWMVGSHWWHYGPIHPCPSSWLLPKIPYSFDYGSRGDDVVNPVYHDLFDVNALRRACSIFEWENFFRFSWDTTQKNWFHAASHGKAFCIDQKSPDGFTHYWMGTSRGSWDQILDKNRDLEKYKEIDVDCNKVLE